MKVKIFCHSCNGLGYIYEKKYHENKTPTQSLSIKVLCPECDGDKYVEVEELKE